jgi:hypothetical protein
VQKILDAARNFDISHTSFFSIVDDLLNYANLNSHAITALLIPDEFVRVLYDVAVNVTLVPDNASVRLVQSEDPSAPTSLGQYVTFPDNATGVGFDLFVERAGRGDTLDVPLDGQALESLSLDGLRPAGHYTAALTGVTATGGEVTFRLSGPAGDGASIRLDNLEITTAPLDSGPTLDPVAHQSVLGNSGPQTIQLTGIGVGPDGAGTSLTVIATSSDTSLIPDPTISYSSPDSTGTLTFTPAAKASGKAWITVTVRRSGGPAGGVDTVTRTFSIAVTPVDFAPASFSGTVFVDFNNDGAVDFGEKRIAGVTVTLTGTDDLGNPVELTETTNQSGAYRFPNLRPGKYYLTESQPTGYAQGINTVGTAGGSLSATDRFFVNLAEGVDGLNYNFGERPAKTGAVKHGQTAGIGFWHNKNGQALIKSLNGGATSTQLGDWLAATFGNLFGAGAGANNLAGKTNAQVAAFFQRKFLLRGSKLDAQVLATALSVYVTNVTLAGTAATSYGFKVTEYGLGAATYNVGSSGAAFGVANGTTLTVMDLLLATNKRAVNGVLYFDPTAAVMKNLRDLANSLFGSLNEAGDIG